MASRLYRILSLAFLLALAPACGEDPLGNDDDGDEDHADTGTGNSDDGTGISGTPKDTGVTPTDGAATGQINGKNWTFVTGSASSRTYDGKTTLSVRLLGTEAIDPCPYDEKRSWVDAGYVKFEKRTDPLENTVRLSGALYYYDEKADLEDSEYFYDDEIALEITENTATRVSGKVRIVANVNNSATGTFSVPVCED